MSRDTRLERLGLAHLSEDEQALKDALETEQTAREAQEAEWEKERQAIKAKRATEKKPK